MTTAIVVDPYAMSAQLDTKTTAALIDRLETRAREPRQRALRSSFLSRIPRRISTNVLEIGCGTGVVAREIAALPGVDAVAAVDPSEAFVTFARSRTEDTSVTFEVADGRALPFENDSFDVVVFATTLCHIPEPTEALMEARRVVVPGGTLLVFDGDYATTNVATDSHDPLQACVDAAIERIVHNPWLVRSLPRLLTQAGFTSPDVESHGYVEFENATYMPTIVSFGADALTKDGVITAETAEALKTECRRRIELGRFFGHIAYASALATSN